MSTAPAVLAIPARVICPLPALTFLVINPPPVPISVPVSVPISVPISIPVVSVPIPVPVPVPAPITTPASPPLPVVSLPPAIVTCAPHPLLTAPPRPPAAIPTLQLPTAYSTIRSAPTLRRALRQHLALFQRAFCLISERRRPKPPEVGLRGQVRRQVWWLKRSGRCRSRRSRATTFLSANGEDVSVALPTIPLLRGQEVRRQVRHGYRWRF